MALEKVFFGPRTPKRLRQGPLASKLDGSCEWLDEPTKRSMNSN